MMVTMCDCLCALGAATASGVTLFAKNSDRPPDEAQAVEWFPPRRDDGRLRTTHIEIAPAPCATIGFIGSRPTWAWGVEHGVNEAGVAIGNEAIYTTLDPRPAPPGLIGIDLVRLALERAPDAERAVDVITTLLDRHGQGGSGHHDADRPYWSSFMVADPHRAFVVETSGKEWATETVTRTRAISNRTTIPSFDAVHRHPRQPVATLVDPRWRASRDALGAEPVSVAQLEQHLRAHAGGEGGWTVCMHVEGLQVTTAAIVAELPAAGGRPEARFLLGHPCRSIFVPLFVGEPLGAVPSWDAFAGLGPEHRGALDALEQQLEEDATDDPGWNAEAWRRVAEVLRAA
jgi:hypothetical protein